MNMKQMKMIAAVCGLLSLTACYYDKEQELYPNSGNCNTPAVVSFRTDIQPLLNASCTGCHDAAISNAGVRLDNYTSVKIYATNGLLFNSVNWSGGASPMPKGGNKLPACKITLIQNWVNAGAPNN
jgi:hypothetical protein